MRTIQRSLRGAALAGALALLATPAQGLMISATVTSVGGVFHYEFVVDNDNPTIADLVLVTITDAPIGDALIGPSLSSPAGFVASYDNGLGLLDLLPDLGTLDFPPGPTGVFAFDSAFGPTSSFRSFEAFTLTSFPVPEVSGSVAIARAPEPGGLALLGLGLGLLAWTRRPGATASGPDGQPHRRS
jgi:hypothetical protein